jgi:hypothetical protein
MDLWGAVKVPDISSSSSVVDEAWHFFGDDQNITYSSLLGVPVAGLPESGNSTFNIVSHYWSVECGEFAAGTRQWTRPANETGGAIPYDSMFSYRLELDDTYMGDIQAPSYFTYTSLREDEKYGVNATVASTNCSARIIFVESRVDCTGRNCRVGAMRHVKRKLLGYAGNWFSQITRALPGQEWDD